MTSPLSLFYVSPLDTPFEDRPSEFLTLLRDRRVDIVRVVVERKRQARTQADRPPRPKKPSPAQRLLMSKLSTLPPELRAQMEATLRAAGDLT